MRKKFLMLFSVTGLMILLMTSTGYSQYDLNRSYLGPTIGLSFLGSTFQFGANY